VIRERTTYQATHCSQEEEAWKCAECQTKNACDTWKCVKCKIPDSTRPYAVESKELFLGWEAKKSAMFDHGKRTEGPDPGAYPVFSQFRLRKLEDQEEMSRAAEGKGPMDELEREVWKSNTGALAGSVQMQTFGNSFSARSGVLGAQGTRDRYARGGKDARKIKTKAASERGNSPVQSEAGSVRSAAVATTEVSYGGTPWRRDRAEGKCQG
jgi:hypothetical protein